MTLIDFGINQITGGHENINRSGVRIPTVKLCMSGHHHVTQLPAISRQRNASEAAGCEITFMSGDSCGGDSYDIAVRSGSIEL